jgi:hypothetical protein
MIPCRSSSNFLSSQSTNQPSPLDKQLALIIMPYRLTQNPLPLIPSVPQLDGNSVVFPAWRARLEDVLAIQGVLDIVQGKVP